jgi:hypothetical protein
MEPRFLKAIPEILTKSDWAADCQSLGVPMNESCDVPGTKRMGTDLDSR